MFACQHHQVLEKKIPRKDLSEIKHVLVLQFQNDIKGI